MEQVYKMALEMILKFCEKDNYSTTDNIKIICKMALKQGVEEVEGDNDE